MLTAKVAGWDWLPLTNRPLTWLVTLPFHLLPAAWVPLALNLFSAALAALTLGVVARSIELLPDFSPPEKNWAARIPVLLGLLVGGLQLDFWLEATAFSGEMLDTLLLAAAVWCVLEHRAKNKNRWLRLAAFIWGVGMAENWVMLVALPLFLITLLWLKRLKIFKRKFFLGFALAGLAGGAVCFLPPLIHSLNPHSPWSLGECWMIPRRTFKDTLHTLYFNLWAWHRLAVLGVILFLLVPVLPCVLRMKNENAPNLPSLDLFQVRLLRTLRFGLLLTCVWLAFDPLVGPRAILASQTGIALPLLTFNYLSALGVAFLAGNLLFPMLNRPQYRPRTWLEKSKSLVRQYPAPLLLLPTLLVAAGLLARNLPALLPAGRPPLENFGRTVAVALPPDGGVLLGEDGVKLTTIQAALARRAEPGRWAVVDFRELPLGQYRAALQRRFPADWSAEAGELKPGQLLALLHGLAQTNKMFALQPHNGEVLLELFQPQPLGAVDALKPYAENRLETFSIPTANVGEIEKFWDAEWRRKISALATDKKQASAVEKFFRNRLGLIPARRDNADILRHWYSELLDDWGVTLQRAGKFSAAQIRFRQALALNPENLAASANALVCSNLLAGVKIHLDTASPLAGYFRSTQQLALAVGIYGEMDAPSVRCLLGNACLTAGWPRQSWAEFSRAHELAPDAVLPMLAMAQIYTRCGLHAEVLAAVKELGSKVDGTPAGLALELELAILEARTFYIQTNSAQGRETLSALLAAHPDNIPLAETVFKAFLAFGDATNALAMTDTQLAKNPDNISALNNRAALLIQSHRADESVPILDHALALTNLPSIRLNRAIALLQLEKFAAAQKDYRLLTNAVVDQFSVHFGLAQIDEKHGATNAAIGHLEICLTNAPPGSVKWQQAGARLDALKNSAPR